jgi:transcription elongation factor GreA
MTKAGADRLRGELERLKSVERPRVIAAIAEARAHGDLKENAEYHAAREQQGFIEGRIKELEDENGGEAIVYQIVGDLEADIKQGRIAVSSPIARALIGKNEGDSFEFQAPGGKRCYDIVGVRYEG